MRAYQSSSDRVKLIGRPADLSLYTLLNLMEGLFKMTTRLLLASAALGLAGLACSLGGSAAPSPTAPAPEALQAALAALPAGDATRGQQLFTRTQPCHVCHMDQAIGPKFPGDPPLAVRAATRRPGYSAELYLYESITHPDAFVAPGFQPGIMPGDFAKLLSAQDLADIIAYLETMR